MLVGTPSLEKGNVNPRADLKRKEIAEQQHLK